MKSLLGKHFSDPDVQEEKKKLPFKLVPMEDDHIGIEVFYDGAQRTFTPEQITAILLNHCAVLAQKENKTSGKSDVVISVPPFWNDAQRRAMYHASQIAGVRCLRLINENAATALDYGIYRNLKGEFSDKPVHVLFVDMGYTATHATVAAFTTGKVQLLSCAYDRKLGSRCCDEAIADYIAKGFIAKYHSDPRSSPRSMAKLMAAAEKVKKTLSPAGVTKTPIYIECLHEDRDYQSELTLKDFQKMCADQGLPERLQKVALQALKEAGLSTSDAFVCEIIGGGMRVPQMKAALAEALGKKLDEPNNGLSTTLNMDETVARGCAMQCAILSPRIRVKSYEIVDVVPYTVICRSQVNGKTQELELYKKGDTFPSYRRITFHTKEDIHLQLEYSQESLQMMMAGTRPMIAQTTVKALEKMKTAEDPVVYVNFCFDAHGLCYLYNASVKIALPPEPEAPKKEESMEVEGEAAKEEEKKEEVPKEEKKEEAPKEEKKEEKKEAPKEDPKEEKKPEIKYSTDSLETQSVFNGLTVAQIKEAEETEKKMLEKDAEIRMRNEAKNDLEAYVYMMRDRVNNMYKSFILDEVRTDFMDQLDKAENWLYDDEGYNASRETFVERLSLLKKVGDPVVFRYTESQNRPEAVTQLSQRLESLTRQLDTPNEKYDHITAEERKPVRDLIMESKQWLEKMLNEQAALAMTVDPVLKCSDCFDRIHNVDALFNKVMSKPKPKPKEEKKEEKKEDKQEEKKEEGKEKMEEEEKKEEPEQSNKMEEE